MSFKSKMQWCLILFLIYVQYISLLLMPATNGLSLIAPTLVWIVIRFVSWNDYKAIHTVIRSHLFGLMFVGLWTIVRVMAVVIVHEIISLMESMGTEDKQLAGYVTLTIGIYITLSFYYSVVINLRRFRRGASFIKRIPLPITKNKYDTFKQAFSPQPVNSNVDFGSSEVHQ